MADAIYDSVAAEVEAAPLTPVQRAELERRLADSIARPDAVAPWEVIKGPGAGVSLPVVLRDEAQAEFDASFDFYDTQRVGLGPAFVVEVQRVFDRIAANPLLHQVAVADVRRRWSGGSRS